MRAAGAGRARGGVPARGRAGPQVAQQGWAAAFLHRGAQHPPVSRRLRWPRVHPARLPPWPLALPPPARRPDAQDGVGGIAPGSYKLERFCMEPSSIKVRGLRRACTKRAQDGDLLCRPAVPDAPCARASQPGLCARALVSRACRHCRAHTPPPPCLLPLCARARRCARSACRSLSPPPCSRATPTAWTRCAAHSRAAWPTPAGRRAPRHARALRLMAACTLRMALSPTSPATQGAPVLRLAHRLMPAAPALPPSHAPAPSPQMTGDISVSRDGSVTLKQGDGIDFAPVTVKVQQGACRADPLDARSSLARARPPQRRPIPRRSHPPPLPAPACTCVFFVQLRGGVMVPFMFTVKNMELQVGLGRASAPACPPASLRRRRSACVACTRAGASS